MLILRYLLIFAIVAIHSLSAAQLTSNGCPGLAEYPNSDPSDSIYFFLDGTPADLTATPPPGLGPYTYTWSYYDVDDFNWILFETVYDVPSSTIDNMPEGAYAVSILDGQGNTIFCDIAWIAFYTLGEWTDGYVDVLPIDPSCTAAHLVGTFIPPTGTPGYTIVPPNPMFVDANTEIQICFSGTHTWVSDLGFYLVGPAACGSPTVLLSPNPGSIGQGTVCNNGDNISNLCFTTESSNNLDVCLNTPFTLSGTYSTYGPSATPIDWSPIYGCEVTNPGWSVQIYDCISGDTGYLTDATFTFTGDDLCGDPQTVSYTTPPGFSSFIADNSCSPQTASIFSVPPPSPPQPIECEWTYEWSSDPYVYIADSTTSLDFYVDLPFLNSLGIPLNPQPQAVLFTLTYYNECTGEMDTTNTSCFGSGGGTNSDSEMFYVVPYSNAMVFDPGPICIFSAPFQLSASPPGGIWSGPGIVDANTGLFDPALAGQGAHVINYEVLAECFYPGSITIFVEEYSEVLLNPSGPFCENDAPEFLNGYSEDGTINWSGSGVASNGLFDPSIAGPGLHTIFASSFGDCAGSASIQIEVNPLPNVNAGPDQNVCGNQGIQLNAIGASSYVWSPATDLSNPLVANPFATPNTTAVYTVTGTSSFGCVSSDDIVLTIMPEPELETTPAEPICPGETVDLIATGSIGTYLWSPSWGIANPDIAITTASPSITTTYTVTLTDVCSQVLTSTVLVEVDTPVYLSVENPDASLCQGEVAIVEAIINGSYETLEWTSPDGLLEQTEINNPIIHISESGSYFITVITSLGCDYSDSIELDAIPLPEANLPPNVQFCPGDFATLNAGNWDSVIWSTQETSGSINAGNTGNYSVIVTENGCISYDTTWVQEIAMPNIDLGPDLLICEGSSVELSIDVNGIWNTSYEGSSFIANYAGTYFVSYTEGPCSVSDTIQIVILPLPVANLGPDITGCIDNPVMLSAYGTMNSDYAWSTTDTTSTIEVLEPGLYSVTTSNTCGEAEDVIAVFFEDCSYQIFIPNTFTPDKDGINDIWQISTYRVKSIDIRIFNRWGDILYTSQSAKEAWTGETHDGAHYVQDGSYAYYISFETEDGEKGERTGHINIIR
ncbi:MAG: gliding motility-associated C-terminal domain-containing protein [Flavobacteriales bacterium]